MAEIVNLRQARKIKGRADREAEAAANRAKFGRSKAERQAEAARLALEAARLDAHKRND